MMEATDAYKLKEPTAMRRNRIKRWFVLALLLSTWVPMAFFITLGHFGATSGGIEGIKGVLLFLGTAHVPATLFFYTDKDFSSVILNHKARYVYLPLLLTVGTGLSFVFANASTQAYLLLFYWAWQAHHYGRQNIGVYAFVSLAERTRPSQSQEKLAIDLATACGILGTFQILGSGVAPDYLKHALRSLYDYGMIAFLAVIMFGIAVYVKNFKSHTPLTTVFFFTLLLFFFPLYVSDNINVTFLSYAIAHGVQYIIFMTVVSIDREKATSLKTFQYAGALKLVLFVLVLGVVFYRVIELKEFHLVQNSASLMRALDFATGAVLGATMAHFVVDAGAWRMSQERQRAYMRKKFAFIFE